ncbi:zinc-binding dehydrogenase [Aquibacillus salsiterrae]|uniref:Zinc-binding dehydrogenase n=1 Tax=Aquibacillus salsiterrae TaxID=2950439 RepID=A0A9X3WGF6_9BACI|nr:zinc-binding dehydrogenase [Aquibacillus salsiterrae]MDC3416566.1 zinc-binding dehydrogenase [Aquibacillus salsiterrae]
MKAFIHEGKELKVKDMVEQTVSKGMVKVRLKVAGINHRDLNIPVRRGHNPVPLILGSDGAGVVDEVGEGVNRFSVGDEVIINPALGWYDNSDAPPAGFEILGMPDHGTFAESIVIDEEQLEPKPLHMSWEEAGVLALSALTGYRALVTKGKVAKGDNIFIPGAGSGVATFIIQFANAMGARVIVSSRHEDKRQKALYIGASRAIDTNSDWKTALVNEQIDIVIESVGNATFNRSLSVLKKGGKIVTFGATTEDHVTINIREFFYGQYQLLGTTMGSREEFREMLSFIEQHQIKPTLSEVFPLDHAKEAFAYLQNGRQFGKVALKIGI